MPVIEKGVLIRNEQSFCRIMIPDIRIQCFLFLYRDVGWIADDDIKVGNGRCARVSGYAIASRGCLG